ncbi:hypothetical protein Acr_05g0006780 [Actinidia rufa]|uniref:Uncharacterized protein n=1 Tax=Actinidia rufa TaxID=165716 RepID=A0A7J0EM29_9ERIC|nr:hypothetical protein Acr_05g0006780 [Actinidia rufa]
MTLSEDMGCGFTRVGADIPNGVITDLSRAKQIFGFETLMGRRWGVPLNENGCRFGSKKTIGGEFPNKAIRLNVEPLGVVGVEELQDKLCQRNRNAKEISTALNPAIYHSETCFMLENGSLDNYRRGQYQASCDARKGEMTPFASRIGVAAFGDSGPKGRRFGVQSPIEFEDSCVNSFDEAEMTGHRKNFPFPALDLGVDLINNEVKIAFVGRILENREPKVTTKVARARDVENLFCLLLNLRRFSGVARPKKTRSSAEKRWLSEGPLEERWIVEEEFHGRSGNARHNEINPRGGEMERLEHATDKTPFLPITDLTQIQSDNHVPYPPFLRFKVMNPFLDNNDMVNAFFYQAIRTGDFQVLQLLATAQTSSEVGMAHRAAWEVIWRGTTGALVRDANDPD